MSVFAGVHMPSLDGATGWLNSEPLGPAELRGHVMLMDSYARDVSVGSAQPGVTP
jgi:hypothetical protein